MLLLLLLLTSARSRRRHRHFLVARLHPTRPRARARRLALFGSFRHAQMHMPSAGIKPPAFEPLDSPKRKTELRYSVPTNLWEHWGEGARRVSSEARL